MMKTDNLTPLTLRKVVLYILFFLVIVCSFELVPSGWLERCTAETASNALGALGLSSDCGANEGKAYLTLSGGVRDVKVSIIRECTAINILAIITGLVVPIWGGLWPRKILSLALAGVMLFILNVSRIMLTVILTAFEPPLFSWVFTNPTLETYHYSISFLYGLVGVAVLVVIISKWILPELEYTLMSIIKFPKTFSKNE